jgi:hypothetical protein
MKWFPIGQGVDVFFRLFEEFSPSSDDIYPWGSMGEGTLHR